MADTRIWVDGDPEPDRDVDTVTDVDGDTWERWMADDDRYQDMWMVPGDPLVGLAWKYLVKDFGPLRDATYQPRPTVTVHLPAEDVTR